MSAATAAGLTLIPACTFGTGNLPLPMKRKFGKIDFDVTTLGLGGPASIQWTPEDVDPVKIILKAFETGINYFDTSNLYQQSQTHYGTAFRQLNLIPGEEHYDEALEKRISRLLVMLMLAREDGKSPVEYLTAEKPREVIRRFAGEWIPQDGIGLDDLAKAWRECLSQARVGA